MHSSKFLGEGIVTSATSVQNPEENFDVLFVYSSTKVLKQVFYSIKVLIKISRRKSMIICSLPDEHFIILDIFHFS